jgi:predicted nucleotidyltransferase
MQPAPDLHRRFLDAVLPEIRRDSRMAGVALSGSLAAGDPDRYSDVDLIVVVDDGAFDAVMAERLTLAGAWTDLVAGFTGEHVGEPRLIITLVGPPLLHVDVKFVRLSGFADRGSDPEILWDRAGRLAEALSARPAAAASFDPQWIEDRFWIWVHYGATKIGRGELFEAISFLNYLRETVLGPLAARRAGAEARGVRHLESVAPKEAGELRATLCGYDRREAAEALIACAELYVRWLGEDEAGTTITRNRRARDLTLQYLDDVMADRD